MVEIMPQCHQCSSALKLGELVGRADECPSCSADVRVCLNCGFHDPNCENECREPNADRVVEKDRSTFCDYFRISGSAVSKKDSAEDTRARFQNLFKK